ncbi:MAG: ymfC [Rhizobium sp.]|nr:ymfC [Rhizobium sp.]
MESGNRRAGVRQLHDEIVRLLAEADLKPGDQIPTEAEFKERLGGARPTIREALKLLEQEGVVRAEHGRGRFLTAAGSIRIDRPITAFESITDMANHFGYSLINKVLSVSEEHPTPEVASALGITPGETVIRLERLRLNGREPVIYCLEHIRRDVITDRVFDIDWSGSLLETLARYGARPTMSQARVHATMLPEEVAARHDLKDFGPALVIEETAYRDSGPPVIYALDYHRGSRFAFSFLRK